MVRTRSTMKKGFQKSTPSAIRRGSNKGKAPLRNGGRDFTGGKKTHRGDDFLGDKEWGCRKR